MSDITISYKGSNIATMDATGTKTLLTEGKYCEDDIEVAYTKPSGGSVSITDTTDTAGGTIRTITATGATVPIPSSAIAKIILNGTTQIDLTQDTVAAANLISPNTAHGADGQAVVGTASGGGEDLIKKKINGTLTDYIGDMQGDGYVGSALASFKQLVNVRIENLGGSNETYFFDACAKLETVEVSFDTTNANRQLGGATFRGCSKLKKIVLHDPTYLWALGSVGSDFNELVLDSTSVVPTTNNTFNDSAAFKNGGTGGTIYIPKSLYDHLGDGTSSDYKAATNWSTFNGYGTITWAKIEGSWYETHYADGTPIPTT